MGTKYELRRPPASVAIDTDRIGTIAKEIGTYPVLVYALLNRGFGEKEIREIVQSDTAGYDIMETPLNGAAEAAERILNAIKSNKRIGIFADYDCDGVTSGFVMQEGLHALKRALKSSCFILLHYPQRKDGYGLSNAYCEDAAGKLDLVITVDNGIATKEQEAILKKHGIDLVVTDHHEPNAKTLPSCIIVDPCYSDLKRSYLAGVAVAYNVIMTAARQIGITLNKGVFMPAVMLGTISDCMPMTFENACYIKSGLQFLNDKDKFSSFYQDAFYDSYKKKVNIPPTITAKDISFTVAPKVNSASRMGDTRIAAAGLFFGVESDKRTLDVAKKLSELNDKRKAETSEINEKVVSKMKLADWQRVVTYNGSGFSKGLHGIIASKIANRFSDYPAFVYSIKDGVYAGSVRCDNDGIDCMEMFEQLKAEGVVRMCAGHSHACVLEVEDIEAFERAFSKLFDTMEIQDVVKTVDATTSLKALSNDFLEKINQIPFTTQEKPRFLVPNVFINEAKMMSGGKHVRLSIADNTSARRVDWWNMGQHYQDLGSPKAVHLVCTVQQDFRSNRPCAVVDIIDMIPIKEANENAA